MAIERNNGDMIPFLKQKDYVMINNNLGSGSFGQTVLLQDPLIDELFVAKKYEPEFEADQKRFYKNFLDEIKILYKLNHRNIVRIYNYYAYEAEYTGYIIMEYIDGKDIGTFIDDYFLPSENITLDDIFIQIIDAFCYIEEHGIIHRDIREGNILIDKNGIVKIIDFGIGKIFAQATNSSDSLVGEINRAASDTLPQEYYNGIYTNLTDMFYIAELFNRLICNAEYCDLTEFSYVDILNKMMEKIPEDRYESFVAVRDAIGKHDFVNIEISQKDKKIYQDFTNKVYNSLISYSEEARFNTDPATFILRLEKAVKINLFETVVQKNADVIKCIIDCGCRYNNNVDISCSTVTDFLNWFKNATVQSQELILNNFAAKLSTIKVDEPEDDLPF